MKKIIQQTFEILNTFEKKQLKIIFFITIIANFLETLSISLIFPLVSQLINKDSQNKILNFDIFKNIFSDNNLLNIFIIFLIVFFLKLVLFCSFFTNRNHLLQI